MDDARCREFFSQPTQTYHRRYEALRAIFIEDRSHQELAEQFGFELVLSSGEPVQYRAHRR